MRVKTLSPAPTLFWFGLIRPIRRIGPNVFCTNNVAFHRNSSNAKVRSAAKTYMGAILFLLPGSFCTIFSTLFLHPKFKAIWEKLEISEDPPAVINFFVSFSGFVFDYFQFFIAVPILVVLFLEFKSATWRRLRGVFIGALVIAANSIVLAGLLSLCIIFTLAIPLSAQKAAIDTRNAIEAERESTRDIQAGE